MKRNISFAAVLFLTSGIMDSPVAHASDFADGRALIRAMHSQYQGKWYAKLRIEQEVIHYRDGKPERREVWNELHAHSLAR